MGNKICAYSFADDKHMPDAELMLKSFKKFCPDVEMKFYGQGYLEKIHYERIPGFWYKSTSFFAKDLLKDYDLALQINADSIITGPLDDIFNNTVYDVACVMNNNRTDPPITVFNVPANMYVNCGLVAMRSREFAEHWWDLCNRYYFEQFPMREQDLLNIMIHYGNYNIMNLDGADRWYGVVNRGEWMRFELKDGKLVCPPDPGYNLTEKQVCVIHAAGGDVRKWNWNTQFTPEVVNYLKEVTK